MSLFPASRTTSQTYNFAPSAGEIVINAFGKIQIRPSEITAAHMYTARMALNELLSEWSNLTPNLWEVSQQQIPLVQGSPTYTVPAETVMILDFYISSGSPATDRYLYPISRSEYASYAVKTTQGTPSVYWFDRLISPQVTLYLVPDGSGPYIAKYFSVRQTQDADITNNQNVEIPYRFFAAYIAGMAWKLSEAYAPQMEDKLFARYQRALTIAQTQDVENVPLYITPALGGYWR